MMSAELLTVPETGNESDVPPTVRVRFIEMSGKSYVPLPVTGKLNVAPSTRADNSPVRSKDSLSTSGNVNSNVPVVPPTAYVGV